MIIKKIILSNIRSYENAEIEFSKGSVLLSGDIGSGKTSILLGIEFALFGLQPGQRGSSLLRSGADSGKVTLVIEVDEGVVVIERSLVKKAKTISQENAAFTLNGEREEISHSELKNKVLKILNYPMEFAKKTNLLYKFTVYTPQEEMKQIIREDAQTRLNAIRHVFGVNKYKIIRENISILSAYLREEIRNKEGIIRDLDSKKQILVEKIMVLEVLERNFSDSEYEFKALVTRRKEVEERMAEIKNKIDEKRRLEGEIEKTKVAISGKRELISGMEKEIKILNEEINEIRGLSFQDYEIRSLEEAKASLDAEEEGKKNQNLEVLIQVRSLKVKNDDINSLKEKIMQLQLCPTCLQNVDNSYKNNILKKLSEEFTRNTQILKECDVLVKDFESVMDSLRVRRQDLNKKFSQIMLIKAKVESIKDKESKLAQDHKSLVSANKDIDLLNRQIETLKEGIRDLNKYENIYIKAEEEFRSALRDEREADIHRNGILKEIEITKDLIFEMEREVRSKEDTKDSLNRLLEIYDWLIHNFSELVAFTERNVLIKLREEFNKVFNEWFNVLVPEVFSVSLDEDFTPVIYQHDYELDYSYLSGGERTAVALAYRLALNKTINSMLSDIKTKNLVILDEPTDGFSDAQLDKMRDVLEELDVEQLIIVSHSQKIESFVEKIIRLKKDKGASSVVYE